jgi:hypothetical protein
MSQSRARQVAGPKKPAAEKTTTAKVAKVKTAICISHDSMECVDAACVVERMTQSELFEFLIKEHLSGYYAAVRGDRRIKPVSQASPAAPVVPDDRSALAGDVNPMDAKAA